MKHDYINKRWLYLLGVVLILSLSGCRVTGGGVQVDWGNMQKETPHPEAQTKKGGPPPHAPAHGYRAKYSYQYYPSCGVYFDISRKVYFYFEGTKWRMSVSLPQTLYVKLGDYVSIEMDTDKPYTQYEKHKHKYPPGQLKKKKWESDS